VVANQGGSGLRALTGRAVVMSHTILDKEEEIGTNTVLALLDNAEQAEKAVHALQAAGFSDQEISIVMRDWSEEPEPGTTRVSMMAKGAIAGGVAGATPGLLTTLASFLIPGLRWVQAIGPLIAILGATPGVLFG